MEIKHPTGAIFDGQEIRLAALPTFPAVGCLPDPSRPGQPHIAVEHFGRLVRQGKHAFTGRLARQPFPQCGRQGGVDGLLVMPAALAVPGGAVDGGRVIVQMETRRRETGQLVTAEARTRRRGVGHGAEFTGQPERFRPSAGRRDDPGQLVIVQVPADKSPIRLRVVALDVP
ncbi:MAG: hypothetical protein ABSH20_06045 [Tepidisphaeraceae bacterium]